MGVAVAGLAALALSLGVVSASGDDDEPDPAPATSVPFSAPESTAPRFDEPEDTAVQDTAPETTEATPPYTGSGLRGSPIPIGEPVDIGDGWTVRVVEVNLDATEATFAENPLNDPPAAGRQFVMPTVEVSYDGAESRASTAEIDFTAVGASNVEFGGSFDDWCGAIPNDLSNSNDLFQGGSVTGTVCWSVEAADVDSLEMIVQSRFSFDDAEATFFALR